MENNFIMKSCPVCFEDYNHQERLPRILPCIHTLCELCLIKLLDQRVNGDVSCPQCRRQFPIKSDGIKSFTQNIYILSSLENQKGTSVTEDTCDIHKRPRTLYCTNEECKKMLCQLCFLNDHKGHNLADADTESEKVRKRIFGEINEVTDYLGPLQRKLKNASAVLAWQQTCITTALKQSEHDLKMEIEKYFNKMYVTAQHRIETRKGELLKRISNLDNSTATLHDLNAQTKKFRPNVLLEVDQSQNLKEILSSIKNETEMEIPPVENLTYIPNPQKRNVKSVIADLCGTLQLISGNSTIELELLDSMSPRFPAVTDILSDLRCKIGPLGTKIKFQPPTGYDDAAYENQYGKRTRERTCIHHQCITAMSEYEMKSLEELRLEDYAISGKLLPNHQIVLPTCFTFSSTNHTDHTLGFTAKKDDSSHHLVETKPVYKRRTDHSANPGNKEGNINICVEKLKGCTIGSPLSFQDVEQEEDDDL